MFALMRWEESPGIAKTTSKIDKAKGLLNGDLHLHTKQMRGKLKNEDVWVAAS